MFDGKDWAVFDKENSALPGTMCGMWTSIRRGVCGVVVWKV